MNVHEKYSELLWDLLDGELDEETSKEVKAHIGSCDECRSQLEHIKKIRGAMADAVYEPQGDIRSAVMDKISAVRVKKKGGFRPYFGIGTAAALVIVAALFFVSRPAVSEDSNAAVYDMQNTSAAEESYYELSGAEHQAFPSATNGYAASSTSDAEDGAVPAEKAEPESDDTFAENLEESTDAVANGVQSGRGEAEFLIKASLDDFKATNSIDLKKTADIVIKEDVAAVEDIIIEEKYTYDLYDDYLEIEGEHYGKMMELLTKNNFSVIYGEPYDGAESTIIYSNN